MTDETWKPVREFPDHYEISSHGRLRRTHAYRPSLIGKIRKPQKDKKGYVVYMLSVENKVRLRYAHRLVADAFLGPIPDGWDVNHKDGNKGDPTLGNLEIVTKSENRAHAYQTLGVKPNRAVESNGNAKLDWPMVDQIRKEYAEGKTSHSKLASKFGVNRITVMRVLLQRAWRDEDRPSTL